MKDVFKLVAELMAKAEEVAEALDGVKDPRFAVALGVLDTEALKLSVYAGGAQQPLVALLTELGDAAEKVEEAEESAEERVVFQ